MQQEQRTQKKVIASISYIGFIVLLNTCIVYLPGVPAFGERFSPADVLVGGIYLVRDFAQQELRHYIFLAMLIGAALSYFLASKALAIASVSGFAVGEVMDWAIYTFTKKPLSQRLIWSAVLSSPLDSWVFLGVSGRLHWLTFTVMTLGKIMGVIVLWSVWKIRATRPWRAYPKPTH